MIEGMSFPLMIRDTTMIDAGDMDGVRSKMGEEEFRAFYERTARPLWAYLSRIACDRQKADDLLQEAYYRFYRSNTKYEGESHRRNALFLIATNLVRDAARRGRHYQEVSLDEELAMQPSASATPERQAAARTDLARAMEQLPPAQREMLWLAYAQGASHEEIATMLGLRAVSIRTLLLRARRKLAVILNGSPLPAAKGVRS